MFIDRAVARVVQNLPSPVRTPVERGLDVVDAVRRPLARALRGVAEAVYPNSVVEIEIPQTVADLPEPVDGGVIKEPACPPTSPVVPRQATPRGRRSRSARPRTAAARSDDDSGPAARPRRLSARTAASGAKVAEPEASSARARAHRAPVPRAARPSARPSVGLRRLAASAQLVSSVATDAMSTVVSVVVGAASTVELAQWATGGGSVGRTAALVAMWATGVKGLRGSAGKGLAKARAKV